MRTASSKRLNAPVHWFGKPFPQAFAEALGRLDLASDRVVMVGDTLHNYILGGAAAGSGTGSVANLGSVANFVGI